MFLDDIYYFVVVVVVVVVAAAAAAVIIVEKFYLRTYMVLGKYKNKILNNMILLL